VCESGNCPLLWGGVGGVGYGMGSFQFAGSSESAYV
jgi:hypothetical protein